MAGRWSDEDIAATLNRMALPTEQGQAWNAIRVGPYPRTTTVEAAAKAGVSCPAIRKLLQSGILPAPGRLRCSLADSRSRSGPPGSPAGPTPTPTSLRPPAIRAMIEHSRFPALEEGAHNETNLTTPRRLLSVALLSMGTAGSSRNRSRPAATDQNGPHLRRRHRDPGLS